jgi:hypothetical protein
MNLDIFLKKSKKTEFYRKSLSEFKKKSKSSVQIYVSTGIAYSLGWVEKGVFSQIQTAMP